MFRRLRAGVTTLVLVGAGLFVATPAHAEPQPIDDRFENHPEDRWVPVEVAGHTRATIGPNLDARSSSNAAFLNAWPETPTAARILRTITIDNPPPPGEHFTCTFYVFARKVDALVTRGQPSFVELFLRIHAGGPTGEIISTKAQTIAATTAYARADFDPISFPRSTVTLDIGAYRGAALIDDLKLTCVRL